MSKKLLRSVGTSRLDVKLLVANMENVSGHILIVKSLGRGEVVVE